MISDEKAITLSDTLPIDVETYAADEEVLASSDSETNRNAAAWDRAIDERLIEWGSHPELLEDDGLIPPTSTALRKAWEIARQMQADDMPPPTRIVPNGDGGLSLEQCVGNRLVAIEVEENGDAEILLFEASQLVGRSPLLSF